MPLCLLILTPEREPPFYVELDSKKIMVGRSSQARVCLPDASISLKHCSLRKRGHQYLLVDEKSSRGTAILQDEQWTWLSDDAPRVVSCGTIFKAGDIQLKVVYRKKSLEALDPRGLCTNLAFELVQFALSKSRGETTEGEVNAALDELLALPEPSDTRATLDTEAISDSHTGQASPRTKPRASRTNILDRDKFWDLILFITITLGLSFLVAAWFFMHKL